MLGDHSYKYLTADEMKSLGDDSMPIDVTHDEKHQKNDNTLPQQQNNVQQVRCFFKGKLEVKLMIDIGLFASSKLQ